MFGEVIWYPLIKKSTIFREADSWKRSKSWFLVSKSRRNHKFFVILASDSAASGSNDYQKSTMSTLTDA